MKIRVSLMLLIVMGGLLGPIGCKSVRQPAIDSVVGFVADVVLEVGQSFRNNFRRARNEWKQNESQHAGTTIDNPTAKTTIIVAESPFLPSETVSPGTQIEAILVYQGERNISGTFCREDSLQILDENKKEYIEIKKFQIDQTLPTSGGRHVTTFTIPAKSPAGKYLLKSCISKPTGEVLAIREYSFEIKS